MYINITKYLLIFIISILFYSWVFFVLDAGIHAAMIDFIDLISIGTLAVGIQNLYLKKKDLFVFASLCFPVVCINLDSVRYETNYSITHTFLFLTVVFGLVHLAPIIFKSCKNNNNNSPQQLLIITIVWLMISCLCVFKLHSTSFEFLKCIGIGGVITLISFVCHKQLLCIAKYVLIVSCYIFSFLVVWTYKYYAITSLYSNQYNVMLVTIIFMLLYLTRKEKSMDFPQ